MAMFTSHVKVSYACKFALQKQFIQHWNDILGMGKGLVNLGLNTDCNGSVLDTNRLSGQDSMMEIFVFLLIFSSVE